MRAHRFGRDVLFAGKNGELKNKPKNIYLNVLKFHINVLRF